MAKSLTPSNVNTHTLIGAEASILTTLRREHAEITALIGEAFKAKAQKRRLVLASIRHQLQVHANCEEQVLYPACDEDVHTARLIATAEGDHEYIEELLLRLQRLEPNEAAWTEALKELQDAVGEHLDLEENRLFPQIKFVFDRLTLRKLGVQYRSYRNVVEAQLNFSLPLRQPPENTFARRARH